MKTSKILGVLGALLFVLSFFYFSKAQTNDSTQPAPPDIFNTLPTSPVLTNSSKITTSINPNYSGLSDFNDPNVGKIETYSVQNASGTVILIPQQHQTPGSDAADKLNDLAEITQKQIYGILSELKTKFNLSFVMAEGDLYGPVPEQKMSYLSNLLQIHDQLLNQLGKLTTSTANNRQETKQISSDLQSYVHSIDRELTLSGAPYRLKAEGVPLTIYGIENQTTMNESADAVRDYVYLQDRLGQLAINQNENHLLSLEQAYLALFPTLSPAEKLANDLYALGHTSLTASSRNTIETVNQILKNTINLKQSYTVMNSSSAPSRSDNPYKNIYSQKKINDLLKKADEKIQKLIIDRRNEEIAQNVKETIMKNNLPTVILQLGAGHETGIVKDLNNKGLSVVVITPAAIAKSPSKDQIPQ